ncbi:MAG: ATP-dependent helicase, partial [Chlamydiae bacterium]|nr:ATP-dependent helicase [Chlamydiota bacterium]
MLTSPLIFLLRLPMVISPHFELCLSPEGILYTDPELPLQQEQHLTLFFKEDPSLGLLHLGLQDFSEPLPPTLDFWRLFSKKFITKVCKLVSSDQENTPTPTLTDEELQEFIESIPFMKGAEYLSHDTLLSLWAELSSSLQKELKKFSGSLQQYLEQYSPHWNLLAKVCFHLAENKNHPQKPFAFLATYTTALSQNATAQHLPLKRALQSSSQEKISLLPILTPLQKTAEKSPFIKSLVDSGKIFEVGSWDAKTAYRFLVDIPLMEENGISVRVPNWWTPQKKPRLQASVSLGTQPSTFGADTLFDFDVQIALGDETLTQEEWQALQQSNDPLVYIKGKWVEIDREKLNNVLNHWQALKRATNGGLSFQEALRLLSGLDNSNSLSLDEWSTTHAGSYLKSILDTLKSPGQLPLIFLQKLQATLRPYQEKGANWLWTLYKLRLGGCLADDMGLGKTLQVLSLFLSIKEEGEANHPHLLIVPASLLGNWLREAKKFTPSLVIAVAHSSVKTQAFSNADIVLTTYGFVQRMPLL